ncbi:ABC transporter substrate-binding protein [Chloroflexota bacterium]
MKKKTVWLLLSCLMALSLVLSSCAPAVEEEEEEGAALTVPKYGGELTICLPRDVMGFDDCYQVPWRTDALHFTHDQLLIGDWTKGPGGTGEAGFGQNDLILKFMTGNLAESWEVPDPDTVIFHIRQGIKWQDKPPVNGREFVAEDMASSFRRAFELETAYMNINFKPWFESATAPDKYTLVIKGHDSEKYRTLEIFANLSQTVRPVAPEVIEQYGDQKDWRNVVGTGPFIMKNYVEGGSLSFDRNPNYHMNDPLHPENQLPYPDRFTVLVIKDASTRLAALRTGKIDLVDPGLYIGWEDAASLMKTNPELHSYRVIRAGIISFDGRIDRKPFDDIRVRRALQMAINNQEMVDTYYGGNAEILTWPVAPIPEFSDAYVPLEELPQSTRELFEYHPDKAKELLAEAGYPDGFKTSVVCRQLHSELMEIYKAYWEKVGVDLEIQIKDDGVHRSVAAGKTYEQMVTADKASGMPFKFLTQKPGGGINYSLVDDPYINERTAQIWAFENRNNFELQNRLARENVLRILDQAYTIQHPGEYLYAFWQPWVGGYNGEYGTSYHSQMMYVFFTWIDENVKAKMTGAK